MGNGWRDLAGHHGWATAELLTYCQGLDAATLNATAPGTYGTIIETLRHLLDAEMSYVFRLTRAWTERPWTAYEAVGIDVLQERAALLAETLDRFLADDWDDERLGEGYGDDQVFDVRAGVFLAQTIHHANEHRAHVCTIIGALGHEPPDVSAWGYAVAAGRSTPRPSPEV
jgi:uncharacterized damage-inducible protein DinB